MTDITSVLPHRYPFLMVDRIVELESGQRVTGYKLVTTNEWYMSEHDPVMPHTMIIEALAQLGAFTSIQGEHSIGFFSSMKGVACYGQARPGDRVDMTYEVTKAKRGFVMGRAEASVGGQVLVQAEEITIFIQSGARG
ncbi:3-hydroxyacyl-ACP dehydratase FabZ family protein [Paenibacillus daejeonensis]|uniref:3-hydroxyacyl-ACP dehydratase FabZ family protein n=1 Tax=Paenibacillus daejeonensis TaxID=135193 RepID=UPI000365583C|nr:3-hydroxyacyl-ACP dehydratase FabZ family protein [Paenibacillus daejeonensis]